MIGSGKGTKPHDVDLHFCGFQKLMPYRVNNVLLVSSLYESFILEEEGLVSEMITSEFVDMNLSHAPRVSRVSTAHEALEYIESQPVDLVITMTRLGRWNLPDFADAVKAVRRDLPLVVLAGEHRELARHPELSACKNIDRIFVWNGDAKMILAIVKFIEDFRNAEHDTRVGDVRVIILVENSVRFYSAYLPLIYNQVVKLTQALITDGINLMHRLLRMRARPKILLADTFEDACELYDKFKDHLLGVICDVRFPRGGVLDDEAGLRFVRLVRAGAPHLPVLLQSSDARFAEVARELEASFLNKGSQSLLQDLQDYLIGNLGFGDFVFVTPEGSEVGRAHDLRTFQDMVAVVPDESLVFHARNNHFSNWLMARTEFGIAARIRPRKVSDFSTVDELRAYLLETLAEFRERDQTGVVTDFVPARLDVSTAFTRIGSGSIGGKARGLAFINAMIRQYALRRRFDDVAIAVPRSAAIGTNVFDEYLDLNHLRNLVTLGLTDEAVANYFIEANLPEGVQSDLRAFLREVRYPLAVRSSSLLEDSHDRPFAGVYATHMLPNSHPDFEVRLAQLCCAVKLVYASAFFKSARRYLEATGRHAEEEKMGVILQEIVGSEHGGRFYPTFSGVVRSYNFYPTGSLKPEDGVASVALGLGKTVVEGGQTLLFSPATPQVLPQFPTVQDMLSHSQREFYALDISHPDVFPTLDAEANVVKFGLDTAEADGTLASVGSVYSQENDAIYDGVFRDGPRLVTFAHVLKSDLFPLAAVLRELLEIGQDGMACPIEIEFAVDMCTKPMEFGFLQIRPIIAHEEFEDVSVKTVDPERTVCYSPRALGNGQIQDIRDIVYVKPETFDSGQTRVIASQIANINDRLNRAERHCVLIGPGRWGSADHWLGIPVAWDQISSAQVIIETTLKDFVVTLSQGTHFFQNLTSLGVGYFNVDPTLKEGFIDWEWLAAQESNEETSYVRCVRLAEPLDIRIDGRSRQGLILKPNARGTN